MSIKSPTVSVIISANRDSQYLLETIDSVKQQSFPNFEICICYDGNPSDRQEEWYERQQDHSLKTFQREDLNSTEILNLGIAETKGEYIALLNAGDLWHPQKLEKQLFYLEHYPYLGLIHSWLTQIGKGGKSRGKILKCQLSGWVESEILRRNQIGYSTVVIRRNCLEKVGVFDPRLKTGFDWDMWIRLSHCYEFSKISESLVYYRQPRNQIRESWLTREKDLQATIEKAYQNVSGNLLDLKDCSYGYASLNLAWQVLHDRSPDPVIVDHYCRQALEHCPRIGFSREFIQISFAATLLHCLGRERYVDLDSSMKKISSWRQRIGNKFQEFAHLLLHLMLQEENKEQETGRVLRRMRDEG